MTEPRILVVGGVVMDLLFAVTEWPRLGEAIQASHSSNQPGGKGLNQAVACSRLGAEVHIVSALGEDVYGQRLRQVLDEESISQHVLTVARADDDSTDMTVVLVLDAHPGFVGGRRATNLLSEEWILGNQQEFARCDAVLVTLDVNREAALAAIRAARAHHKRTILNAAPPDGLPLGAAFGLDYVVVNELEARRWLESSGIQAGSDIDCSRLAELLGEHSGAHAVIVTRGNKGCILFDSHRSTAYQGFEVVPVDETGAGDAFCAALAVGLCEKRSPRESVKFAAAAGALASQKLGAYNSLPRRDELESFLKQHDGFDR